MSPELQRVWERLQNAKLRHDFARNYLDEVQRDNIGGPDGLYAFQRAIEAENRALAEYNRLLREYRELLKQQELGTKGQSV